MSGARVAAVLLGLLADEEAARLVLVPTRAQLDETTRWFRAQHKSTGNKSLL